MEFPSVIFYSKSRCGFTAVDTRSCQSMKFLSARDMFSSDNFRYVFNRQSLCSVAFARSNMMPRDERLRNRNRKKVLSAPINLDLLRQGEFRSRKGFSQLSLDTTAVAIVDYDHGYRTVKLSFSIAIYLYSFPHFFYGVHKKLRIFAVL